jgi:hypothetical protein
MSCDTGHGLQTAGDGVLRREELEEHIRSLSKQSTGYMADLLEPELRDARRALRDMDLADADGIEYLPESCKELPENLRRRVTEMLLIDDEDARGVVTPQLIAIAQRRYRDLGSVPSWVMRSSRDTALDELDQLKSRLFPEY